METTKIKFRPVRGLSADILATEYNDNKGIYKYTLTSDLNGTGNFITFGEPHFISLSDNVLKVKSVFS